MMITLLFIFIPSALCVLLETPLGVLNGRDAVSTKGKRYYAFEGVPYAQPPVGKLRFVAPTKITAWEGVYNATYQRPPCPQILEQKGNEFSGAEDCLHINVYTPSLDGSSQLPVMVFFFGGGYKKESAAQCSNPELLTDSGVVLLSFNYRLGPLGFLTLDTPEVPGNAGLRDAVSALRWVRDYIRLFGGDPENVTLLGVSSGAALIDILRDAQPARGLFHKVIIMSGGQPDLSNRPNSTRINSRLVLDYLNIESVTIDTLEVLQKVPLDVILNISLILTLNGEPYDYSSFSPVYEMNNDHGQAVYVDIEDEIKNCSVVNNIPTIFGHTSHDFFNVEKVIMDRFMITNDDYIVPYDWELTGNASKEVASIIKKKYFNTSPLVFDPDTDFDALFCLLSHVRVVVPMNCRITAISNCAQSPLYHYIFDYLGNDVPMRWISYNAVMHGDELFYLFPMELHRVDDRSSDGWVRRRLVAMFTNFARTGDPTPAISNLLPVKWQPFDPVDERYLHVGVDLLPSAKPDQRLLKFWKDLKAKYVRKKPSKPVPVWKMPPGKKLLI